MTDKELIKQALDTLIDARDNTVECLNEAMPHAGYARYDRRIAGYNEQLTEQDKVIIALRERLKQPDPEPVAFGYLWPTGMHPEFRYTQQKRGGIDGTPVYTAPPRRKWQGLTEPELHEINPTWPNPGEPWEYKNVLAFARAIEDALRERNT